MGFKQSKDIATLKRENGELRNEIADLGRSFELRWKADQAAIQRWQQATGMTMTWPDHKDLCCWLMDQIVELEKYRVKPDTTPNRLEFGGQDRP